SASKRRAENSTFSTTLPSATKRRTRPARSRSRIARYPAMRGSSGSSMRIGAFFIGASLPAGPGQARLPARQQRRIGDDRDRGERHRGAREGRRQDAEGGERDADDVVDEGPAEILRDGAPGLAGDVERGRHQP